MARKLGMLELRGNMADGDFDPGLDRHRQLDAYVRYLQESIERDWGEDSYVYRTRCVLWCAGLRSEYPMFNVPETPREQ